MLLIDSSVGSSDLPDILERLFSSGETKREDYKLSSLPSSDVAFVGNGPDSEVFVGIEIKSVSDLVNSISTARLQGIGGQIDRMTTYFNVRWLIIYGEVDGDGDEKMSFRVRDSRRKKWTVVNRPLAWLDSSLIAVEDMGVSVRYVSSKLHACKWILTCFRRYQKPADSHRFFDTVDRSKISKPDWGTFHHHRESEVRRRMIASCLPNISNEREKRVAKHFGSIGEMINASVEDWERVEGIGKVIAERIYNLIWEE